jgi:glycine oxidase
MASDVVIVGAGVLGCTVAHRLRREGARVTVLERSVPGAEASTAAGGILGPSYEAADGGPALRLGLESRELHLRLAEELRAEHGVDVGFRRCGVLVAAFGRDDGDDLARRERTLRAAGVAVERVDGDAARRLEPSLSPEVTTALVVPEDAQVEPPPLLRGLALAAERAGVRFRTGAVVRRVVVDAGGGARGKQGSGRARGVIVGDGERLDADHVVVAAGSWTSLIPGLALPPETIVPVRGQMLATVTRPPVFSRVVFGAGGYVVTRPDGRVLTGSTLERVGFRKEVTLGGLAQILAIAQRLAPKLSEAPVLDHWASFRPGTPDELPLVGPAGPDGLWLASGHFRNGILLAPVTARVLADQLAGRDPGPDADALDPRRFAQDTPR